MPGSKHWLRFLLPGLFVILCLAMPFASVNARQLPTTIARADASSCSSAATLPEPTPQSLLVVLLDRSSSLQATDQYEYSTSVTRVLADLWPGRMAVIFFSGSSNASPLPMLRPVSLSEASARETLKNQIEAQRYKLGAWTPTQKALEQARLLLEQEGYPSGSRVVLITDGQPALPDDASGTKQIEYIQQQSAPEFSQHTVSISTFGVGNEVPAYAQSFLKQVASTTGGEYHAVTDPAQLAEPVLQMYSCWQGLKFVPTTGHNAFQIDTYAKQVDFVAFLRDRKAHPVTLLGPNNQPIPEANVRVRSLDVHYEFNSLTITRFNTAGTYTISTNDPSASTYALEETRLQAEIISPTSQTAVYAGQPLTVSVALYDNDNRQQHIRPGSGDAVTIGLTYTLTADGKTLESGEEVLKQQAAPNNDLFSAQITPRTTGKLTLTISASYQYVALPEEPALTLEVTSAPFASCSSTDGGCQVGRALGIGFVVALVLLVVLFVLWFLRRPSPSGSLKDRQGSFSLLGSQRTFLARLLRKSLLYSEELHSFDWDEASFALQFKRGKQAFIVARRDAPSLAVWCTQEPQGSQMQPVKVGKPVRLHNEDRILVSGLPRATFYENGSPKA